MMEEDKEPTAFLLPQMAKNKRVKTEGMRSEAWDPDADPLVQGAASVNTACVLGILDARSNAESN